MTELVPKPTVTLKKRSQVKTACINCRKSKTGCSSQRPCRRCCSLGLEDTCHDAPRKKRGKKLDEIIDGSDFNLLVYNNNSNSNDTRYFDFSSPESGQSTCGGHYNNGYEDYNSNQAQFDFKFSGELKTPSGEVTPVSALLQNQDMLLGSRACSNNFNNDFSCDLAAQTGQLPATKYFSDPTSSPAIKRQDSGFNCNTATINYYPNYSTAPPPVSTNHLKTSTDAQFVAIKGSQTTKFIPQQTHRSPPMNPSKDNFSHTPSQSFNYPSPPSSQAAPQYTSPPMTHSPYRSPIDPMNYSPPNDQMNYSPPPPSNTNNYQVSQPKLSTSPQNTYNSQPLPQQVLERNSFPVLAPPSKVALQNHEENMNGYAPRSQVVFTSNTPSRNYSVASNSSASNSANHNNVPPKNNTTNNHYTSPPTNNNTSQLPFSSQGPQNGYRENLDNFAFKPQCNNNFDSDLSNFLDILNSPNCNVNKTQPLNNPQYSEQPSNHQLMQQLERIKMEKNKLESLLENIRHQSLVQSKKLYSSIALSRWNLAPGHYCVLESYSEGFLHLIDKSSAILKAGFRCLDLYRNLYKGKTQTVIDIIGSGKVASLSIKQKIDQGYSRELDVHSNIQEFDNTDDDPTPYFQPFFVKLIAFSQNKSVGDQFNFNMGTKCLTNSQNDGFYNNHREQNFIWPTSVSY